LGGWHPRNGVPDQYFYQDLSLMESAPCDCKKAPEDLAFYKPLIDVVRDASGNKQDI
jgi:hypothetical protein